MPSPDIVTVRHVAPMLAVRKGARRETVEFDVLDTPVRLREASPHEMPHVGRITRPFGVESRHEVHAHDGGLWTPLLGRHGDPLGQDVVLAFLAGDDAPVASSDIGRAFTLTPLLAPITGSSYGGRAVPPRPAGGTVSWDGRDASRSGLAGFLDGNVRLCAGLAYVRIPGPTAERQILGFPGAYAASVHPRAYVLFDGHVRMDDVARDWQRRLDKGLEEPRHRRERPVLLGVEGLDGHEPDDGGLLIAVNQAPATVLNQVGYSASKLAPEARATVAAAVEGLRRGLALSWIGGLAGAEAADVARDMLDVADSVLALADARTPGIGRLARSRDFLAEVMVPGLRGGPAETVDPADEEVLSSLVGGP